MSDAPIESLEELLRALSHERSLGGRLRVLGRAWSLLRSLSPAQREKVALRIGSKWAWKRVEKSFLADGELNEKERLVGRIFEKMGGSDPQELRGLARSIQAGDTGGAQDLLMMTLNDVLEESATEEEQQREARALAESEGVEGELPAVAAEIRAVPLEARVTVPPEPAIEEPAAATLAAPTEPLPVPASLGKAPPQSHTVPEAAAPRPVRREPTVSPAFSNQGIEFQPLAAGSPESSGVERLRVLKSLQRSADPGADLGRAGRAELLASLGGGWATRRALSRMIRQRGIEDLDEALTLIRMLVRPGQQSWCLADLLHHWDLGADEVERVIASAPTGAADRRLRHRANAKRA